MARLGRPLAMDLEERRERIFAVAERLFCAEGSRGVSMAQIAAGAGMSKRTIYDMFDSKEALLGELIVASYDWSAIEGPQIADPVARLRRDVRRVTEHALSQRHINLCRLAIAESIDQQTMARGFLENGIAKSRAAMIDTLSAIPSERRRVDLPEPVLASMLFGASSAVCLMTAMMGGAMPDVEAQSRIAESAVDALFVS